MDTSPYRPYRKPEWTPREEWLHRHNAGIVLTGLAASAVLYFVAADSGWRGWTLAPCMIPFVVGEYVAIFYGRRR